MSLIIIQVVLNRFDVDKTREFIVEFNQGEPLKVKAFLLFGLGNFKDLDIKLTQGEEPLIISQMNNESYQTIHSIIEELPQPL
jgi:hypothetical protein